MFSCSICGVVYALGVLSMIKIAYALVMFVMDMTRKFNPKAYGGKWAVVTGATDGIGRAYCDELAKAGMNIVCVSRTQEKLDQCVAELKKDFKVEAVSIQADFSSENSDALYSSIADKLKGVEVGVLINNVGMSYDHAQYFDKLPQDKIDALIRMNVVSVTRMTHIVLPQMLERKKGAIVNIGSAHGTMKVGAPLYSVYSATKGYVDFFSRSLNAEYAGKGVHIQCQVPFLVTSKLSKVRKTSFFAPNPVQYAKASINCIGGTDTVAPYFSHRVQDWVVELLPLALLKKVVTGMHVSILKRAEKKAAQKKE